MNTLDEKLSSLGRILTMLQISATEGYPALVLRYQLRAIQKLSNELIDELGNVDPSTTVHMDPTLSDEVMRVIAQHVKGGPTPDHLPEEWT